MNQILGWLIQMASDLHINHWQVMSYTQIVSTKEYQEILDQLGSWVLRNGQRADIKGKRIGPGRYEIWLETAK